MITFENNFGFQQYFQRKLEKGTSCRIIYLPIACAKYSDLSPANLLRSTILLTGGVEEEGKSLVASKPENMWCHERSLSLCVQDK
ncbi:MAG TPA: hypothetical protein VE244_01765 [Nitrososphaeraceae archaeon]|jgi:hypothetical protein|nr:hypothetical protein [Nitrososphaeraceae archaeon]